MGLGVFTTAVHPLPTTFLPTMAVPPSRSFCPQIDVLGSLSSLVDRNIVGGKIVETVMFASERLCPFLQRRLSTCADHEHLCHCSGPYGDTHKSSGPLVLLFLLTPASVSKVFSSISSTTVHGAPAACPGLLVKLCMNPCVFGPDSFCSFWSFFYLL